MKKMKATTNLEANLAKLHLYASDDKIALECMKLCENAGIATGMEGEEELSKKLTDVESTAFVKINFWGFLVLYQLQFNC